MKHDTERMLAIANRVVYAAIELANHEGQQRTGAYFCVMHRPTHQLVLHVLIGDGPGDKTSKWREYSAEKCVRLLGHPEHQTSYETRAPEDNRWGGAVLGTDYALSLSGLKELDDEASMFLVAIRLGQRDRRETLELIDEARNPQFRPFLDQIHWTE